MFLVQDYTLIGVPHADAALADANTWTGAGLAYNRARGIRAGAG